MSDIEKYINIENLVRQAKKDGTFAYIGVAGKGGKPIFIKKAEVDKSVDYLTNQAITRQTGINNMVVKSPNQEPFIGKVPVVYGYLKYLRIRYGEINTPSKAKRVSPAKSPKKSPVKPVKSPKKEDCFEKKCATGKYCNTKTKKCVGKPSKAHP